MSQLIEPAVLPLEGARAYLSLGLTSIYSLISEGKLDARKFGKKVLISKESCDRFLAGLPAAEVRKSALQKLGGEA